MDKKKNTKRKEKTDRRPFTEKTLIDGLCLRLKDDKIGTGIEFIINLVFPRILDWKWEKDKTYREFYEKKGKNKEDLDIQSITRSDVYISKAMYDFKEFESYMLDGESIYDISNETYEEIRKKEIASFINKCIAKSYLERLRNHIKYLLENTPIHQEKELKEKLIVIFDNCRIIKSINSEIEKKWFSEWVEGLYFYFYYAVTNKLHPNIAFSAYPKLERDLEEYNNKITLMYGVSGNPGMYKLYSLAKREHPNIIALYECGELEYYGKGPSGIVNYQNAYNYYERTKRFNAEHPLATWSIAYMKFHYSTRRAKLDGRYKVQEFEEALSKGSKTKWYDSIIKDAQSSYYYGCSAAANLLGQIVDAPEDIFPTSRKGMFASIPSKQLYKESADGGYVYGCNNYANACLKEAELTEGKERIDMYNEAVLYLKKSAELGNPWASNKLGMFFLNGLSIDEEIILNKNKERAYQYFLFAHVMCRVENYYWPLINLAENFWLNKEDNHYREKDIFWLVSEVEYAICHIADISQIDKLLHIKGMLQGEN